MTEIWKVVEGTNEMYEVSNFGRVRSWFNGRWGKLSEPRILKPGARKGTTPYLIVALTMETGKMKTHYVHKLVIENFVCPRPSSGVETGHLDGDSFNNDYRNLSWVSRLDNIREMFSRRQAA